MANYDLTYEGSRVQGILDTGNSLKDAGYIFRGEATPSTVPGTPTERVAYIGGPGTYTNFGSSITVGAGCICVFKYTGSAWSNQVINTGLDSAVNTLQSAITAINNNIGNGYVYAGVATPSTSPVTGKVFYLAVQAGTYTNFGNAVVTAGLNVIKYNGSVWSVDQVIAIDAEPTQGSANLVKSGGVLGSIIQNGPAFDLSSYNAQGGVLATYADLSAALTALNALPADFKKGGMSMKFVLSSDNMYVQYRLMSDTFNITVANWQGVDEVPTSDSKNLVESGGVVVNLLEINSIYKQVPSDASKQILCIKDLCINGAEQGYDYSLICVNTTSQQLTLIKWVHGSPSYESFVHFVNIPSGETKEQGLKEYTAYLNNTEKATIKIDWDLVSSELNLPPSQYVFKDAVFLNGNSSNNLQMPIPYDSLNIDFSTFFRNNEVKGISCNILSKNDFYPSEVWQTGEITNIENNTNGNKVIFESTSDVVWATYLTSFVKVSDIKERFGENYLNNIKLNASFRQPLGNTYFGAWFVLRYEADDRKAFYLSGTTDAVFNTNGTRQGFGSEDTTTWSDFTTSQGIDTFTFKEINIPLTYQGKQLYAILFCFGSANTEQKEIYDVSIYLSGKDINGKMLYVDSEVEALNNRVSYLEEHNGYYAACGDSITNANHDSIENIPTDDPYCPFDGTSSNSVSYKRKNYAYYLAKWYKLYWASYGWGGSTLTNCVSKAYPASQLHPFVNERITQLKDGINWDYISIMFGWNDNAFGPTSQKDKWLYETYGQEIGYPETQEQIGTDGFATQAQKDACDAATGYVDGIYYDNADDYFYARFVGNIESNDKSTWYGAWNYALQYLMKKYPSAKIMIVAPFVPNHSELLKTAVHNIAEKYGVNCFDFEDLPYWYCTPTPNNTPLHNPDDVEGRWQSGNGSLWPATITGYNQARYSYDGLHPSNLGYRRLSMPFGKTLVEM